MNKRFSIWFFERRMAILAVVVLVALLCSPVPLSQATTIYRGTPLLSVSLMPSLVEPLCSSP